MTWCARAMICKRGRVRVNEPYTVAPLACGGVQSRDHQHMLQHACCRRLGHSRSCAHRVALRMAVHYTSVSHGRGGAYNKCSAAPSHSHSADICNSSIHSSRRRLSDVCEVGCHSLERVQLGAAALGAEPAAPVHLPRAHNEGTTALISLANCSYDGSASERRRERSCRHYSFIDVCWRAAVAIAAAHKCAALAHTYLEGAYLKAGVQRTAAHTALQQHGCS
jgi:hypothetical protein